MKKKTATKKLGIKILGGTQKGRYPLPMANSQRQKTFEETIEERGAEKKSKYPHNAGSIEAKVSELTERHRRGEIHDWYDTMEELDRVATQAARKPYLSGKKTAKK